MPLRLRLWLLLISACTLTVGSEEIRKPLASIPAGRGDLRYEVTAGPCVKRECPIVVALLNGSRALDTRVLEKKSSSSKFEKTELERGYGVGDPAHLNTGITVWRSGGDDEDEMTLAVRPFRLAPDLTGILIDQRTGFEHVKRWHTLLAANDNKLVELWKGSEGAGPTYSTTAPVESSGGRQALLFYSVFFYPGNDAPDKLRIDVLAYDPRSGRMSPYKAELNGLTLGPYKTVAETRQTRSQFKSCGAMLWVLPASGFPDGKDSGYVLATVASTRGAAEAVEAELKKCAPTAKFSAFRLERDSLVLW